MTDRHLDFMVIVFSAMTNHILECSHNCLVGHPGVLAVISSADWKKAIVGS